MTTIDEYLAQFDEEPGYLDFAKTGPVGAAVRTEERVMSDLLGRARFGTLPTLEQQDERVRTAIASVLGFRDDQVGFQPSASQALMHTMFGITGGVALSAAEFPSVTFAVARAADALGVLTPLLLETDDGRVTPGNLRDQLTSSVVAVVVSLVDFRTGYLVDLEGIRQVIGDRLLIVDATQALGVVNAPYELADVVVASGRKWMRAGWGTGLLALSDRAAEQLTPVFSGFTATDADGLPLDEVLEPTRGVRAFEVTYADPVAQARFATAIEQVVDLGVPTINALVAEQVSRVIDLADEFGLAVSSSRDEAERAGIVVLTPPADQLTVLTASLFNHGVSATTRDGSVRLSPHVTTTEDTFSMLRGSLTSFASAVNV